MTVDVAAVLNHLRPVSAWTMQGNDYGTLVWLSDGERPTWDEIEAAWPEVSDVLAWAGVREKRDRLLAASDWTQVADAPVDRQAWAVYRQALRDIPQDFASPDAVVWPEVP